MDDIVISLSDGTKINTIKNTTYYELSKKCKNADNIIGVLVNNKIASLNDKIIKNENVTFLDINDSIGNRIYVAGLKMAFEYAVYKTFPLIILFLTQFDLQNIKSYYRLFLLKVLNIHYTHLEYTHY